MDLQTLKDKPAEAYILTAAIDGKRICFSLETRKTFDDINENFISHLMLTKSIFCECS